MTALTLVIFLATYVLIAARRVRLLPIGRPAAALLGATLMLVAGVLTPSEAYGTLSGDTLLLLLGMMLVTAELDALHLFPWLSAHLLRRARTPRRLLVATALLAATASALFVNDTVCLFLTPVLVATCLRANLPLAPYLIVLATSANLGSAATLVGNPQNMLIGSLSEHSFLSFFVTLLPIVIITLIIHIFLSLRVLGRRLPATLPPPLAPPDLPPAERPARRRALLILIAMATAFVLGAHLGVTSLAAALALIVTRRRDPADLFLKVDWSLLLFFAGLFIVTGALEHTGLLDDLWSSIAPALRYDSAAGLTAFTATFTLGSNLVSNVPLVMLAAPALPGLGDPALGWTLTAWVTTVAGNLTLIGSVANLIVAERARPHHELGFWEYARFGIPATLLSLAVGVPLLVLWAPVAMRLVGM